jgi:transposase-like protein
MMRKVAESRRWFMTLPLKQGIGMKGGRKVGNAEKLKVEKPGLEEKKGRRVSGHTAKEKCRAVLSVWTEKRKPGEVCRELGIAWTVLNQWQERAIEGMLLALQPRAAVDKAVALNSRLAVLLERKSKGGTMKELERRLARLQGMPAAKQGEMREAAEDKKV